MDSKERKAQEAVGSLKLDETIDAYDVQYFMSNSNSNDNPGFILTMNGEQIPFTCFDDVLLHFKVRIENILWDVFSSDGEIVKDKVKHIELTTRITHTDA